ncbi:serine-rich adhesin for platelets-like isoform X2 [Haliotis asinina]|uniref:serine-rich adhesin for platelets-like isoform X2 n=2 Tax=Haliotis asinina TaxID=109174 RepID=UPI00353215F5
MTRVCVVSTMGVSKVTENGEKSMEVWYFCRFSPPKVTSENCPLSSDGEMDPHSDTVEDDGGGEENSMDVISQLPEQDNRATQAIVDTGLHVEQDTIVGGMDNNNRDVSEGDSSAGKGVAGGGGDINVEEQLVMIEEMVHEMKQGFVIAMEELTKIQEGDNHLQRRMQDHRDSVDRVISSFREQQSKHKSDLIADIRREIREDQERHQQNFTDMIATLKNDINTVSGHLREVLDLQKGLQQKVSVLQTERDVLLEELVKNGAVSERVRHQLVQREDSLTRLQKSDRVGRDGFDAGGTVEDDVTASACKCLSLLQALEERCILPDLSDSSDDDDVRAATQQWKKNSGEKSSHQTPAPDTFTEYQTRDTAERQQSVQDIIDSEREYCGQLWSLLDGYLTPLQEGLYVSTRELNLLLPPSLQQLYDEHCQILHILEDRLQHWTWGGMVGDVFAKMTDTQTGNLMSLYKEYLSDFPAAINCLRRQVTQSRKFRDFIKREDRPNSGDIVSLLTAPIRRIPQYSLLLQQLLKNTAVSHPDQYTLQSTLTRLRNFVDQFSDEITHTVSHDKDTIRMVAPSLRSSPSGSSCDTGQPASARDSGIHSNGEEQHSQQSYNRSYTPDWVEMTSNYREGRGAQQRLAAQSQPDLTFGRHSTGQLPKGYQGDGSIATRPPVSDKMSHHKRYKLKKKGDRQGGYYQTGSQSNLPPDYATTYSLPHHRHRPASAIDFISRHESSQLRHSHEHLHSRPQSAMGLSGVPSNRSRPSHHQIISRRHQDNAMNRSMPGTINTSHSSSMIHSTHLNNSFPAQRSFSPFPHDSPRILVNGHRRESYPDSYHGITGSNYGVYGDEDHGITSAHSLKYSDTNRHYMDNSHSEPHYSEDLDLAVSLADSLSDQATATQQDGITHRTMSQGFDTQITSPGSEDRGPGLETASSHNKSDRSMHTSDLQLNLESVQDTRSDTDEARIQQPVMCSDSSDQPNSSFDESVRSESRNSEHKMEESSDIVTMSQSQSPSHSSDTELRKVPPASDTTLTPTPNTVSHTNGNTSQLSLSSHTRRLDINPFENSVLSFDERMLSNHKPQHKSHGVERPQSDIFNSRTRNTSRLSSPFPQPRPADFAPDLHTSPDETDGLQAKKDSKKKKEKTKRYNSMENLSKSSEDVSSKKTFKSSLKHFFGKKKGSVRMDKLEAQFAKEHGLDCIPPGPSCQGGNSILNNNNDTKIPLVKLMDQHKSCSTA